MDQTSSGPFFVPGWTRHHCACIRKTVESRLCYWPPIFRDVLLFYKPGACSDRPLEELERDQGLQERCVLVAEGSRREGGEIAFARDRCQPHDTLERASGLHWRENRRPLQAFNIPLLEICFFRACLFLCLHVHVFVNHSCAHSAKSMWRCHIGDPGMAKDIVR